MHSQALAWDGVRNAFLFSGLLCLVFLLSLFNPWLGTGALGLLLVGVLLGINLKWGVLALIFLIPFDAHVEIAPGLYFYLDLLFALPFLPYLWRVLAGKLRLNWASLSLVPYVLFSIVTGFSRAENAFWFWGYSARLLIAAHFAAVVASVASTESMVLALGLSLIPISLYGVYQLLIGDLGALYLFLYPHYHDQPWTDRAYSFFFHANNFGGFCAVVSVMVLALALRTKKGWRRYFCYLTATFGFVGLMSSGSRGAWLAAIGGLAVLFLFSRAKTFVKSSILAVAVVAVFVAKALEYAPLARVEGIDAFTIEGRLALYGAAWLLFLQQPLIGIGLTNFQELMPSVVQWDFGVGTAAHSTYMQLLAENGIVGFLLFFGPVFRLLYQNLGKSKQSTTALMSSVGLLAICAHGLFDFQFAMGPQYLLLFAVVFGIASKCGTAPMAVPKKHP